MRKVQYIVYTHKEAKTERTKKSAKVKTICTVGYSRSKSLFDYVAKADYVVPCDMTDENQFV